MEIGKINDGLVKSLVDNTNKKTSNDQFEKKLKNAVDKSDNTELKKVCQDFEQIFLSMMFKQMKASVPKTDLFESDSGEEIFESMLDDELMEEASRGKGVGLAEMLYKQLAKKPEAPDVQKDKMGDIKANEKED